MRVIRAHLLLLICSAVISIVLGVGVWYVLNGKFPIYTSSTQMNVSAGTTDARQLGDNSLINLKDLEPEIKSQIALIMSEGLLDSVLRREPVRNTEWYQQFGNPEEAREALQESTLSAFNVRGSAIIRINAGTRNNTDAQTILREVVTVYMREVEDRQSNNQIRAQLAYQTDLDTARQDITNLKADIQAFELRNPRTTVDERLNDKTRQLLLLTDQRTKAMDDMAGAQAYYDQQLQRNESGLFEPTPDEIPLIEQSIPVRDLRREIRQTEIFRQSLIDQGKGASHPTVRNALIQIQNLERELIDELDKQAREIIASKLEGSHLSVIILQERIAKLDPQILEVQTQLQDINRIQVERDSLDRLLQNAESRVSKAMERLADIEIIIARTVTVTQLTQPTTAEQTFPLPQVVVPAVSLGFFAMVLGLVFLRELIDQGIRSSTDITSNSDTAMLGTIPDGGEDPSGKQPIERVVEKMPAGLLAESFRQVRTAVLSKMDRRGYKTLMVVSAKPSAGVSSIVQNLSASMALSGRRVLIIDANFRRPTQAALIGAGGGAGLVEYLRGDAGGQDAASLIHKIDGTNQSLLPAGNSHGAQPELLENPAFREMLSQLEAEYDIILIDAPPALLTSEAQLLAKHVDAIALVARAGVDSRGMVQRILGQLDGQRADILGVILNGIRASAGGYLRKNFQEFHRYQGDSKAKSKRAKSNGHASAGSNGQSRKDRVPRSPEDSAGDTVIVDALQDVDEFEEDLD